MQENDEIFYFNNEQFHNIPISKPSDGIQTNPTNNFVYLYMLVFFTNIGKHIEYEQEKTHSYDYNKMEPKQLQSGIESNEMILRKIHKSLATLNAQFCFNNNSGNVIFSVPYLKTIPPFKNHIYHAISSNNGMRKTVENIYILAEKFTYPKFIDQLDFTIGLAMQQLRNSNSSGNAKLKYNNFSNIFEIEFIKKNKVTGGMNMILLILLYGCGLSHEILMDKYTHCQTVRIANFTTYLLESLNCKKLFYSLITNMGDQAVSDFVEVSKMEGEIEPEPFDLEILGALETSDEFTESKDSCIVYLSSILKFEYPYGNAVNNENDNSICRPVNGSQTKLHKIFFVFSIGLLGGFLFSKFLNYKKGI
ncbi:hypothetical protein A3Q56_02111 [Intoshia linei]|uniref:Uncharacterized protein n=1 Tax=Intoshia linei TaxID=1819745 RepID=A0A177B9L4_9BILA|nr:hypothetical protein A3Q56_02111 [Intoshia linei]